MGEGGMMGWCGGMVAWGRGVAGRTVPIDRQFLRAGHASTVVGAEHRTLMDSTHQYWPGST